MMASDGADNSSPPDLKIDDIEVEIVIICKNETVLNQSAAFLTRRDWPATVLNNVARAIEVIAERRPDFVLISFSHPSPVIEKLPELITQTFNLICIGFIEGGDPTSMARLSNVKLRNKVHGAPSGPNFQRIIRKVLAENLNILDEETKEDAANGSVTVRGGSEPPESNLTIVKSAKSNAAGVIVPSGSTRRKVSLKSLTGADQKSRTSGDMLAGLSMTAKATADAVAEAEASNLASAGHESEVASPSSAPGLVANETAPAANNPELSTTQGLEKAVKQVEQAAQKALSTIYKSDHAEKAAPLGEIEQVVVFPILSSTTPGYLVVASPGAQVSAHSEVMKRCRESLRECFDQMQVSGQIEDGFMVTVPRVDFARWAAGVADFHFQLVHETHEIGVAFFRTSEPLPRFVNVDGEEMLSIPLDEFSTEHTVNFNAYIHLKENNKFYLYLRGGRQLQPEQKLRLSERNVVEFFVKLVEQDRLRHFLAISHLAKMISRLKDEKVAV